jgi:uncharacterized lipoprotein YbaY
MVRKLRGKLIIKRPGREFDASTEVTICFMNFPHKNLPDRPIAQAVVQNPKSFPAVYELEFDEQLVNCTPNAKILVQATLHTNERLDYSSIAVLSLIDSTKTTTSSDPALLDTIDIELEPVPDMDRYV